jgi:Tol biopolymer transport system component
MTRPLLTDAVIREAFARRAAAPMPPELYDAIVDRTATTRQEHAWISLPGSAWSPPRLRMALTLLILASLLAIATALALNAIHPRARLGLLAVIRQDGIHLVSPDGSRDRLVVAGQGANLDNSLWSSDGRFLAFQGPNGVHLLDSVAGTTRAVAVGGQLIGWEGDRVLIATSGSLRLIDPATGAARTIRLPTGISTGGMTLAPNGRWVAAWSQVVRNALHRIDLTSGEDIVLWTGGRYSTLPVTWSPDSSQVAFADHADYHDQGAIRIVNTDGSGSTELSSLPGDVRDPVWSPAGSWIAFVDREISSSNGGTTVTAARLAVAHPDGTALHYLADDLPPDVLPVPMAWSADGGSLVVTRRGTTGDRLWLMALDGTAATDLAASSGIAVAIQPLANGVLVPELPEPPQAGGWDAQARAFVVGAPPRDRAPQPASAYAGFAAAYTSTTDTDSCTTLLLRTWAGVTSTVASFCSSTESTQWAVAPDGLSYAISVGGTPLTSGNRVRIVATDGNVRGESAPLPGAVSGITWSPGAKLLVVSWCRPRYGGQGCDDAWSVLRPDGTEVQQLTAAPVLAPDGSVLEAASTAPADAVLSPDRRTIAYVVNGDVWISGADGSRPRQLTHLAFGGASGIQWSPDGSRLAFTTDQRAWVVDTTTGSARYFAVPDGGVGIGSWSPDGVRVMAGIWRTGGSNAVVLLPANGTAAILLDGIADVVWSPDGRYAFLSTGFDSASGDPYAWELANADGSGRTPLPRSAGLVLRAWIPAH